jgi:hypothetical protein
MAANVSVESAVFIFSVEYGGSGFFRNYEFNAVENYKKTKCTNQTAILFMVKCIRLRVFVLAIQLIDIRILTLLVMGVVSLVTIQRRSFPSLTVRN